MAGFFTSKKDTKPLLKEENEKLQEEVRALKEQMELHKINAQTYYDDFLQERKDRELAMSQKDEVQNKMTKLQHQLLHDNNHGNWEEERAHMSQQIKIFKQENEGLKRQLDDTWQQIADLKAQREELRGSSPRPISVVHSYPTLTSLARQPSNDELWQQLQEKRVETERLRHQVSDEQIRCSHLSRQLSLKDDELRRLSSQPDPQRLLEQIRDLEQSVAYWKEERMRSNSLYDGARHEVAMLNTELELIKERKTVLEKELTQEKLKRRQPPEIYSPEYILSMRHNQGYEYLKEQNDTLQHDKTMLEDQIRVNKERYEQEYHELEIKILSLEDELSDIRCRLDKPADKLQNLSGEIARNSGDQKQIQMLAEVRDIVLDVQKHLQASATQCHSLSSLTTQGRPLTEPILLPEVRHTQCHFQEPELRDLINLVGSKLAYRWRDIGLQLRLSDYDIRMISSKYSNDPDACCREMFIEWHQRCSSPYQWSTIFSALQSPALKEQNLSMKIQEKLLSRIRKI